MKKLRLDTVCSQAVVLSMILGSISMHAQEMPETVDFIVEKAKGEQRKPGYTNRYSIEVSDCVVLFSQHHLRQSGTSEEFLQIARLDLLDPTRISRGPAEDYGGTYQLEMPTLEDREVVYASWEDFRKNGNGTAEQSFASDSVVITNTDQRHRDQLIKAFRHLVTLCGGKSELF